MTDGQRDWFGRRRQRTEDDDDDDDDEASKQASTRMQSGQHRECGVRADTSVGGGRSERSAQPNAGQTNSTQPTTLQAAAAPGKAACAAMTHHHTKAIEETVRRASAAPRAWLRGVLRLRAQSPEHYILIHFFIRIPLGICI